MKKILLPIDLQETKLASKAVEVAIAEARWNDADLHILAVVPGFTMPIVATYIPDDAFKRAVKEVAKELKKYVKATFPDDIRTHPLIAEGNPPEQIARQARELDADLIIIPSHAKGLERRLLGSCAARVLEQSHCSVMVIKDVDKPPRRRASDD